MLDHIAVTTSHHRGSRPPRTTTPVKKGKSGSSNSRDCNASKGSLGLKPQTSASASSARRLISSSNDSTATPSSVHLLHHDDNAATATATTTAVQAYSLTRDLSDLSGSYYNGISAGRSGVSVVPHSNNSNNNNNTTTWRHAKVLSSSRLPLHPQPHTDDESSVGMRGNNNNNNNNNSKRCLSSAIVDRGEVIEVCVRDTAAAASMVDTFTTTNNNKDKAPGRTPLIVLLMDPNRRLYELLQLWMDSRTDTVRDVLQTVNRNLDTSAWKQDYDGLFQVRNNHFSQLINVLQAGKTYHVVAGEVWVAKPWSMSAKQTVSYASTCLNHLKEIGILQYRRCSDYDNSMWGKLRVAMNHKSSSSSDDTVLVLSQRAAQRVYVPEGILKHHHACQFLAFTPAFEQTTTTLACNVVAENNNNNSHHPNRVCVDVLSGDDFCAASAASGLSDSHCGSADLAAATAAERCLDHQNDEEEEEYPNITRSNNKNETDVTFSTTGTRSPVGAGAVNNIKNNSSLRSSRDAASTVSAVTKESAYVFKPHGAIPHVLPSNNNFPQPPQKPPLAQQQQQPRGIVRLLSSLNCAKHNNSNGGGDDNSHNKRYSTGANATARSGNTMTTLLSDSSVTELEPHTPVSLSSSSSSSHHHHYRGWEEDAASQSSGVPLLFAAAQTADWKSHV